MDHRRNFPLVCVVGRFQAHRLHLGHQHLITSAYTMGNCTSMNRDMLFLVGRSPALPNKKNPLPFSAIQEMLSMHFSLDASRILPIEDQGHNGLWSEVVDAAIEPFIGERKALIVGARDSVVSTGAYTGKHETLLINTIISQSATDMRTALSNVESVNQKLSDSQSFREGWMAAATCGTPNFHDTPDAALMTHINRHLAHDMEFREGWVAYIMCRGPRRYRTADSAMVTNDLKYVVLGEKKRDEGKKRFPGGFVEEEIFEDPEDTVIRESHEECGMNLSLGKPQFITKKVIPDWRYADTGDYIETHFYMVPFLGGEITPYDANDLFNLDFYPIDQILDIITPAHVDLASALLAYVKKLRAN